MEKHEDDVDPNPGFPSDVDLDPAFHLHVDPKSNPPFHFDTDPDPQHWLPKHTKNEKRNI